MIILYLVTVNQPVLGEFMESASVTNTTLQPSMFTIPIYFICNQGTAIRAIRPKRFSRAARADRPKSRSIRVSLHVEAERNCFKGQVVLRTNYKNSHNCQNLSNPFLRLHLC